MTVKYLKTFEYVQMFYNKIIFTRYIINKGHILPLNIITLYAPNTMSKINL